MREQPAYSSLEALRVTMLTTFEPASTAPFERLLDVLRESGLPAR
jgi:hypothetical protein